MSRHGNLRRTVLAGVSLLGFLPACLIAQIAATGATPTPATDYLTRYHELVQLAPQPGQVASVDHFVLHRDVGTLTLETGTIYLLAPLGGAPVGAVFRGQGRFSFAPPIPTEQAELQRFLGSPQLEEPLREVVFLFADSTADQLHTLSFGPGVIPADVADHVRDFLGSFKGDNDGSYWSDVMQPMLDGERSGFFLAKLTPSSGGALLFEIDPVETQAVQLYRPVAKLKWGSNWALVTEFAPQQPRPGSDNTWSARERLTVPHYRIEVTMTPTGMAADLSYTARATLSMTAREALGPWLQFVLDSRLLVDSARWQDGTAAIVFKAKDDGDVWVRATRRLAAGDSLALTLYYHGKLIDRFDDWFFINPGAAWFPFNGQGGTFATFDLTFHSPDWYPLATIGDRTDSTATGKVMTTHWVASRPTQFASFNLGLFENYRVAQPDRPVLDVLISEDAHRTLARQGHMSQQAHMRESVAGDVGNSLQFFSYLFGPPEFKHFFVTEIPYNEGVSFPGLIHLSWSTFQFTDLDGGDEWFRAHEVAHQWWGNGVWQGSYRDKWLSEGLASFSALWYLQNERKHNDEYFKFLDRYKADITNLRGDAGPIWLGYRNSSPDAAGAYQVIVYEKGAWVFHMLRVLMLDLSTMKEDRFTETMRDYYNTYKDKAGTTDGFRAVVEQHAGIPMDWFFDEWIKGTGIPTYHVAWKSEPAENGRYRVRLRVAQEHVPPDFQMPVLVSADLGENRTARFRIVVHGPQGEYASPLLPAAAQAIKFNEYDGVLGDVKMEKW
ncbi:MAG TPA: M1 family aminopeptidase [Gemmatimonadales bacterium]|nr:M1 family aminopeptidase [Gemmatimonadales bacterium]